MRFNDAAVVAFVGLLAAGCATGEWSAPDVLVKPGSAVFFAVFRRQVHGTEHSWKRGTIATTEVTATRFRAIDARTCRSVRTIDVPGASRVVAWDGDGDDLWFVKSAEREGGVGPVIARSLSGATMAIPSAAGSAVFGPPRRPVQVFADDTGGLLQVLDVHARVMSSLPRRPGPFGALVDDNRVVLALPGETTDTTTLVTISRAPGIDVTKASIYQLAAPGLSPSHGWLLEDAVAYQATAGLVTFDLRTGAPLRSFPLSRDGRWRIVDRAHPVIVSLAPAGAGGPGCSPALDLVDVTTGARRQLPLPSCVTAFGPASDDGGGTILLDGSIDGHGTHWAMQPRAGSVAVPVGILIVPHVETAGSLAFYAEGQVGARPLMVADLATGARRPATAPLVSIDAFYAEPASDSLIIKTAAGLLAYRIGAAKLDSCDGN
jgi:hypothetical protein